MDSKCRKGRSIMSRLNKTQIYAIRWLNSQNIQPDKIASELDLNIEQVTKTIEKYGVDNTKNGIQSKSTPAKLNNIITETSGKKTNSVAIMTKEASEIHDAARSKTKSTINEKAIFRPKNNG